MTENTNIEVEVDDEMLAILDTLASAFLNKNIDQVSLEVFADAEKADIEQLSSAIGAAIINSIMIGAITESLNDIAENQDEN